MCVGVREEKVEGRVAVLLRGGEGVGGVVDVEGWCLWLCLLERVERGGGGEVWASIWVGRFQSPDEYRVVCVCGVVKL
jgi:hypothetical protein